MKQLRVLVVLLLVLSLGVGTTVIQVLGWATMIPTHLAQTGSLDQAVENTFSGKYPCAMCELAAMKLMAEQDSAPLAPEPKEEKSKLPVLFSTRSRALHIFPPASPSFPRPGSSQPPQSRCNQPDSPPPDVFVVIA